jgi:hypothetical protein
MPKKNDGSRKTAAKIGARDRKPVALTVKIDDSTYVRLSNLRASKRRTHQDILNQALEEYLDREGV